MPVCRLRRGPLAGQIFGNEPFAEIGDRRRRTPGLDLTERVAAAIDLALKLDGFHPRAASLPIRKAADGEPALASDPGAVVEHKGPRAGRGDANAEAFDTEVVEYPAPFGR